MQSAASVTDPIGIGKVRVSNCALRSPLGPTTVEFQSVAMGFNTSLLLLFTAYVSAHTVITYPGWRGNNLKTNTDFPYGMQSIYPCRSALPSAVDGTRSNELLLTCFSITTGGGIGTTKNRTYWPTTGGAVAFQPGWIQGDKTTFAYVNLGFGTDGPDGGPPNMSNPMIKPFRIQAPSDNPYPGTICLPQVPLPVGASVKVGDKATIQLVELAPHGSSLYSVRTKNTTQRKACTYILS